MFMKAYFSVRVGQVFRSPDKPKENSDSDRMTMKEELLRLTELRAKANSVVNLINGSDMITEIIHIQGLNNVCPFRRSRPLQES